MNVALIGCNGIGTLHAQMASNCGLDIVVCADKHQEIADKLAAVYGSESTTDCLGAIRRDDVDIVAITSPTPTHADYIIAAAEAGKHIFCEKPFARTIEQCKAAIAAAKKAKVKLFVAHVVRYFQEFDGIKAQVEAGKVGKPGFVKLYRGGIMPMGVDGWFRDYEQSGGVTLDTMIHDMDWLRYVFGEPDRVFCQTIRRSEPEHLDYSQVTFRMKSGVIAKLIGTWAHPQGFRVEVEVCGDNGMLQFSSEEASMTLMKRGKPGEAPSMIIPANPVPVSPYELEWRDFLSCLEGKAQARVTPEDALVAVKMALAALKSADTGKPVKI